ncbi:unnamed protein product [Gordionus sp. m RMFG-2023]
MITLINKGFDINTSDFYGWTPLVSAISKHDYQMVFFLIDNGATHKVGFDIDCFMEYLDNHYQTLNVKYKSNKILYTSKNETDKNIKKLATKYCSLCNEYISLDFDAKWDEHIASIVHLMHKNKESKRNPHYHLPASNKGFQLLLKNGWNPEMGLGPEGQGKLYPIRTKIKQDKKGFGYQTIKKSTKETLHNNFSNLDNINNNGSDHYNNIKTVIQKQEEDKQKELYFRRLLND